LSGGDYTKNMEQNLPPGHRGYRLLLWQDDLSQTVSLANVIHVHINLSFRWSVNGKGKDTGKSQKTEKGTAGGDNGLVGTFRSIPRLTFQKHFNNDTEANQGANCHDKAAY